MAPYEIVRNNYTWAKEYNLLFVDQPVGTGLSYADPDYKSPNNKSAYCTSMEEVANDFWFALKELYSTSNGCFQQLGISPSQDLFIFGESYAGKYVPAIAEKIKKEQQDNNGFLTGLRGIAIGDGFTNPHAILTEVGEYAYNLGLIDYQERSLVEQYIMNSTYQDRIRAWRDLHDTFEKILDFIVERAGNINVYDITKYHDYPDIIISEYLKTESTKKLFSLKE
jgi:vitellogenic carboxypeptidase-like protein